MHNRKLESSLKTASRRFGKDTLCEILSGSQLISFMYRNSILPEGLLVLPEYGYSTPRNRVVAIPQSDLQELKRLLSDARISSNLEPYEDGEDRPPQSIEQKNTYSIQNQLVASQVLSEFLKTNIVIPYVVNPPIQAGGIESLKNLNILIDSVDVMGTISGKLVTKTNIQDNLSNWDD